MSHLKQYARKITASLIMLGAFAAMYIANRTATANADQINSQFSFSRHALPEVPGPTVRQVRNVHPDFRHLAAYWAAGGTGAALGDLDGDGLANDVCYVDARTDQVIIAALPHTGNRYVPFALDFAAAGVSLFDRERMAVFGCLPVDLDEDGRLDIIVWFAGRTPLVFLSRATEDAGLSARDFVPVEIISARRFGRPFPSRRRISTEMVTSS